jgi:hypothetical protein
MRCASVVTSIAGRPRINAARLAVLARHGLICALCGIGPSTGSAQYVYNPNNADEGPGIRYFGSAKDDHGALLPGVSVEISGGKLTYLLVTDEQGRFRQLLPLDMLPDKTSFKCFKQGYELLRMSKRAGPSAPKQTFQVDCVLKGTGAH